MNVDSTLKILLNYAGDWDVVIPQTLRVTPRKRWFKCVEHEIRHESEQCVGVALVSLGKSEPDLVDFRPNTPELGMFPPWAAYPKSNSVWAGWRQGYGDGYLWHWCDWLVSLPADRCRIYFENHPVPNDGRLWHDWFNSVVIRKLGIGT